MIFNETELCGAFLIEPERITDHRGFFSRIWCKDELQAMGLDANIMQSNLGVSTKRGTLRGLHYQKAPHAETKIIRCPRGAIYDVIVDVRPESPTYMKWCGVELSEKNFLMLYVPKGFAQGYLTLTDDTEIYYHTSERYHSESAVGVRYDDPSIGIQWPATIEVISEQDKAWKYLPEN